MPSKKEKDILISDFGVTTSNKKVRTSLFVFICRALSLILAILGLLAFIKGNFGL